MNLFPRIVLIANILSLSACVGIDLGGNRHDTPAQSATLSTKEESCTPDSLPYHSGWLGGDGGASVALPDGRTFWIFADTFVGTPSATDRWGSTLISSTVGLSHCSGTRWEIEYYWRKVGGLPKKFFSSPAGFTYWPAEVFFNNGTLYVILWKLQYTPGVGLGFKLIGTTVARIDDTSAEDPRTWTIGYFDLTTSVDGADNPYTAGSAVVQGSYVYLYTSVSGPNFANNELILVRSPLATFGTAGQSTEYYSAAGAWEPGLDVADAKILVTNGATKYTVRYNSRRKEWVATYYRPFWANEIWMRTATALEGPWSDPVGIFQIPEVTPGSPRYDATLFCYGAEQHVEYSRSYDVFVSYACNSFDNDILTYDMSIYAPVFERVPIN